MATAVPVTRINRDGTSPSTATAADPTNDNSVANGGKMFVEMENTDTVQHTVSVPLVKQVDGQLVAARTYDLAAGEVLYAGPYSPTNYGSLIVLKCSSGLVQYRAYSV